MDKVLSVFDQTKADEYDPHVLTLDEKTYEGDDNMEYIVHRLTEAAADADMRQDMNVEDEYYSALENRDTAIMNRDKKIREQNNKISEQNNTISEQNNTISEQNNTISQQKNQIRSMVAALKASGMSPEQISKITGIPIDNLDWL